MLPSRRRPQPISKAGSRGFSPPRLALLCLIAMSSITCCTGGPPSDLLAQLHPRALTPLLLATSSVTW